MFEMATTYLVLYNYTFYLKIRHFFFNHTSNRLRVGNPVSASYIVDSPICAHGLLRGDQRVERVFWLLFAPIQCCGSRAFHMHIYKLYISWKIGMNSNQKYKNTCSKVYHVHMVEQRMYKGLFGHFSWELLPSIDAKIYNIYM